MNVMLNFRKLFLVMFVLGLLALPAQAGQACDELLRLVPDDVGFCLIVQDLRSHAESFLGSPFYDQFTKSPLGVALRQSHEMQKLAGVDREFRKHIELSVVQVRDDLLGDAVVLAYRPAPADKPDQEEGLLLIRARDANLLAKVVDRLNALQKLSGELKDLEVRKHNGIAYTCRVEGGSTHFYYLQGPVLAFTSQEGMLKRMLERVAQPPKEPALIRHLNKLGVDDAFATLWINPRAFDVELEKKAAEAQGPEAYALKKVQAYWKAMDGIALTATLSKMEVELGLSLSARDGELPEAARKFFAAEEKPSDLWSRFPEDALLTLAAKLDVSASLEVFADFFPENTRKELRETVNRTLGAALGLDLVKDVLPNLGPDWGVCVLPPRSGATRVFPSLIAALRIQPGAKEKPVDRAVLDGLNTAAVLALFTINSKSNADPLSLKTVTQDKVEVKYLGSDKGQAAGVQPAFALKDGYLVIASNPEAIRSFQLTRRDLGKNGDIPMLRASIKHMRQFIRDRLEELAEAVADKHNLDKHEARKRLQNFLTMAQLFERLEVSRRTGPDRVTIALRLRTEEALRK